MTAEALRRHERGRAPRAMLALDADMPHLGCMDLPQHAHSDDPAGQRRADARRFRRGAWVGCTFVAALWWLAMLQALAGNDLASLALYPRMVAGLIGVLTAPMLHASLAHLLANSLPLLITLTLAFATVPRASRRALPAIWIGSGLMVWLLARPGPHIGASGIAHGLVFFLLALGLLRRDRPAVAAAMIAFFLYGGTLLTIWPREPQTSWEYHLAGAVCGVLSAWRWRRLDPPPARRRYLWEEEADGAEQDALADPVEPSRPESVPVLWQRADAEPGKVLRFPLPTRREGARPASDAAKDP